MSRKKLQLASHDGRLFDYKNKTDSNIAGMTAAQSNILTKKPFGTKVREEERTFSKRSAPEKY